jgi:hypothetical protein
VHSDVPITWDQEVPCLIKSGLACIAHRMQFSGPHLAIETPYRATTAGSRVSSPRETPVPKNLPERRPAWKLTGSATTHDSGFGPFLPHKEGETR